MNDDETAEIWCPEFVPWSCWGVVDPDFDACDMCSCPRAMHPVMTYEDEQAYIRQKIKERQA